MKSDLQSKRVLGLNGAGRIGKLTLWNHLRVGHFDGFVINTGREVGKKLEHIIDYLLSDSTYGSLDTFLYGYRESTARSKSKTAPPLYSRLTGCR